MLLKFGSALEYCALSHEPLSEPTVSPGRAFLWRNVVLGWGDL